MKGGAPRNFARGGFRSAWQIARVVDAILLSAAERRWVKPGEV